MKIAVRQETPSLEADFIAELLQASDEVVQLGPEDSGSHEEVYDLAVCVGPVRSRPLAKAAVLVVMGETKGHQNLEYDAVVATSKMGSQLAAEKFGWGTRVFTAEPPILGLISGRRRLVGERKVWLNAMDCKVSHMNHYKTILGHFELETMGVWDDSHGRSLFNSLEFNSLVRGGAVGFYPEDMEDGYDVQVRRHLALGGRVVAPRNKLVLGDLADLVDDEPALGEDIFDSKIKPVGCVGRVEEYVNAIREILEIWR